MIIFRLWFILNYHLPYLMLFLRHDLLERWFERYSLKWSNSVYLCSYLKMKMGNLLHLSKVMRKQFWGRLLEAVDKRLSKWKTMKFRLGCTLTSQKPWTRFCQPKSLLRGLQKRKIFPRHILLSMYGKVEREIEKATVNHIILLSASSSISLSFCWSLVPMVTKLLLKIYKAYKMFFKKRHRWTENYWHWRLGSQGE